jgi:hypothetical protein
MSEHDLGSPLTQRSEAGAVPLESDGFEPAASRVADDDAADINALRRFEQEQLARDYADIERASAALRLAEPALQSWSKPATAATPKARPLWLLIGVLWLSTALVTAGAVVAIASLAG